MKAKKAVEIRSLGDGSLVSKLGEAHERVQRALAARKAVNAISGTAGEHDRCSSREVESELRAAYVDLKRMEREILRRLWGSRRWSPAEASALSTTETKEPSFMLSSELGTRVTITAGNYTQKRSKAAN